MASQEAEYEKRHNELWPEMIDMIHEHGGKNYTIALDPETLILFGYIEIADMIGLVNTLSYLSASALYVFAVIIVMALIYVFTFKRFDFKQVSYAIVGALYTPLFVTSIFLIRCLNGGKYLFWLIFIFCVKHFKCSHKILSCINWVDN